MNKDIKSKLVNLYWNYIATPIIRKQYIKSVRKILKNQNPSILSSNCIGGEIYNNLNIKFLSPTINLWFSESDFLKLALKPKYYMEQELLFIDDSEKSYPVAMIDDVKINFLHFKTKEEAEQKWNERKKRIDYDNLYIIMCDLDLNDEEFIKFQKINNCKRKIMFTTDPQRAQYKDVMQIKIYKEYSYVRNYAVNRLNGYRDFELFWDYVNWLNEEDK